VFAASVILPEDYKNSLLNDSKKISERNRYLLREEIENQAISWGVAMVSNEEIDKINILQASFLAMHKAIEKLNVKPTLLLIDGNRFRPYSNIPHNCFIKGDGRFLSIAAASILAKTYRDDYMKEIHEQYPNYKWEKNKGYPTREHRKAILETGITPFHRKSFQLLDTQSKINF